MKVHSLVFAVMMELAALCHVADAAAERALLSTANEERVANAHRDFLSLHGHVAYTFVIDKVSSTVKYDDAEAHIELLGSTRSFVRKYPLYDLTVALWHYLDDPTYADEAAICLNGATGERLQGSSDDIVRDIKMCKWSLRRALGQPDWWYPHPILFAREKVLAESKADPAARARYITEMQKALADPTIRTENPLEVGNIINLLCALDAKAASSNMVDYLFFDWQTMGDFRLTSGDPMDTIVQNSDKTPAVSCLAHFGEVSTPFVLKKLSDATAEERVVAVGGGCSPVFALNYFLCLSYTEERAVNAIEDFMKSNQDLSTNEVAHLDELKTAIIEKKYRGTIVPKLRPDWAAPPATNAVPIKRP